MAQLQRLRPCGEAFGEGLTVALMHVEAVGGDADLAGIGELHRHGRDRAPARHRHPRRRGRARCRPLHRDALQRIGAESRIICWPMAVGAGERNLAHLFRLHDRIIGGGGGADHQIDDAVRNARLAHACDEQHGGARHLARRPDDHRAACGQGRSTFRATRRPEVPRREGADDADGSWLTSTRPPGARLSMMRP